MATVEQLVDMGFDPVRCRQVLQKHPNISMEVLCPPASSLSHTTHFTLTCGTVGRYWVHTGPLRWAGGRGGGVGNDEQRRTSCGKASFTAGRQCKGCGHFCGCVECVYGKMTRVL